MNLTPAITRKISEFQSRLSEIDKLTEKMNAEKAEITTKIQLLQEALTKISGIDFSKEITLEKPRRKKNKYAKNPVALIEGLFKKDPSPKTLKQISEETGVSYGYTRKLIERNKILVFHSVSKSTGDNPRSSFAYVLKEGGAK